MILDDLDHTDQYHALGSRFQRAFRYLRETDLLALPPGRYELDGAAVFALVSDYDTRSEDDSVWEAHRRHIDVQCVAAGEELIGVTRLAVLEQQPYDDAKDVLFGNGAGEFVALRPGRFIVLFPHDAHMPGVSVAGPRPVRKVVIKIAVE